MSNSRANPCAWFTSCLSSAASTICSPVSYACSSVYSGASRLSDPIKKYLGVNKLGGTSLATMWGSRELFKWILGEDPYMMLFINGVSVGFMVVNSYVSYRSRLPKIVYSIPPGADAKAELRRVGSTATLVPINHNNAPADQEIIRGRCYYPRYALYGLSSVFFVSSAFLSMLNSMKDPFLNYQHIRNALYPNNTTVLFDGHNNTTDVYWEHPVLSGFSINFALATLYSFIVNTTDRAMKTSFEFFVTGDCSLNLINAMGFVSGGIFVGGITAFSYYSTFRAIPTIPYLSNVLSDPDNAKIFCEVSMIPTAVTGLFMQPPAAIKQLQGCEITRVDEKPDVNATLENNKILIHILNNSNDTRLRMMIYYSGVKNGSRQTITIDAKDCLTHSQRQELSRLTVGQPIHYSRIRALLDGMNLFSKLNSGPHQLLIATSFIKPDPLFSKANLIDTMGAIGIYTFGWMRWINEHFNSISMYDPLWLTITLTANLIFVAPIYYATNEYYFMESEEYLNLCFPEGTALLPTPSVPRARNYCPKLFDSNSESDSDNDDEIGLRSGNQTANDDKGTYAMVPNGVHAGSSNV